jgi:hypothetical protein
MEGSSNGVRAIIARLQEKAVYVHCWAHSLSLALQKTCQIRIINNYSVLLNRVGNLFNTPKRNNVLHAQAALIQGTRKKTVRPLSETRWTALAISTDSFLILLPAIVDSLRIISVNRDMFPEASTRAQAANILDGILNFEFILTATVSKLVHEGRLIKELR